MNLTIGYIPYLNMVPFHQGFGPEPMKMDQGTIEFRSLSPRALGLEAEAGHVDAGAMSLVDAFRLADRYESLGDFGIGVKRAAGSVLLFSKQPLSELQGMCAVTDETSTSVRLLQVLAEKRYARTAVNYGRVAPDMYDGSADSLLLIGDEALRARRDGVKGLPVVTDLATEWLTWQGTPFAFARWVVRKDLPESMKQFLQAHLKTSLVVAASHKAEIAQALAPVRGLSAEDIAAYWDGFLFQLTPDHERAIASFKELWEAACLTA